jgi:stage III sporulation protein AE
MPECSLVWDEMDMDAVSLDFNRLFPEFSFDGQAVLALIMQGKLWEAVRQIGHGITGLLGSQIGEIKTLFITILVLGILAALFTNFADLFRNHQISELAFYFVYLLLIAVLLKSFVSAAQTVQEILSDITTFMRLYIPTYMIAVGSASGIASASAYYQILLVVVYLVEWLYLSVLVPVVYSYVLLTVINGVWMEEKLFLLLELIEKVIGVSLKVTIGIVTGFSLLQSMITPALDSLQTSVLKKAVSAIPGIGGLTEGMFEMVMGSAILIKGSVGVYITLVLLGLCSIPVLKILLLSCVTKLGAALIGIISDKRLTNCADRMGNGNLMLLKLTLSSIGMFIIEIAIITYTTSKV